MPPGCGGMVEEDEKEEENLVVVVVVRCGVVVGSIDGFLDDVFHNDV